MSGMECSICHRRADARALNSCIGCGAMLCDDCAERTRGLCDDCAAQERD